MKPLGFLIILFYIGLHPFYTNAVLSAPIEGQKSYQLASAIREGRLNAFITDQGITQSSRATSALLFEAERALSENRGAEAIRLAQLAAKLSPDSPLPPFFLAEVYWHVNPFSLSDALLHYIDGLSLLVGDINLLIELGTPLALLLMLAGLLSFITFILYSLFSYAPVWLHQFSQHSIPYLHPVSGGLLFCILFLSPWMFGLPPLYLLLFSFLLFWRFYSPSEKGGVMVFLLGLGATVWVLPFLLTLLTAKGSILIDEMSRNVQGDTLLTPTMVGQTEDLAAEPVWEIWFIRAVNEGRQGHYEEARGFYQNALRVNPESPRILINLGNLSFYQDDYDRAGKYYQEAIALAPKFMSAHYNLGQVFREKLLFEEGDKQFAKTSQINANVAEAYAMKSARFPDFPVIEEHFSKKELWSALLGMQELNLPFSEQIWQSAVGPIPLVYSPLLALFCIVLLFLSTRFSDWALSARPCAFCKKAICLKCAKRLYSYQACKRCRMEFITIRKKSDYKIIEDAVRRVPAKLYPLFLLPGGGHLAAQMTKRAFLFLTLFFLLLSAMFIEKELMLASRWFLHHEGSLLPILLIFLLYFTAIFDLVRMRKRRLWL